MRKVLSIFVLTLFCLSNLYSFERTVLAEIFTSTTCGPCASQNPYFDSWLRNYSNQDRVAVIKYHVWWPSPGNDPFYLANPTENSARTNYYFPGSKYVPHGMINGTGDGASSASTWIVLIQNSIITTSQFEIKILGNVDNVQGGNLTIKVTADNNPIPSGTLVLHFAVVESNINYTGPNGDPVHNFVMRKMYPDHNGEVFTINPNETKTFTRVFNWNSSWNLENSKVVAFIQNLETKEVYQAAIRRANIFLATPQPLLPPNGSLNQPMNVTLKWARNSRATNYGLEVATDSLFTSKIFSDTTLTDTFKTLVKLARETKYFWRVKAISSYNISDWSETFYFKTLPNNPPTQVQLIYPENGQFLINPDSVRFAWSKAEIDVDYYRFEVASDSNFQNILLDTLLTDTTYVESIFNRFIYDDFHYWRVTAHNGAGWGPTSQFWWFGKLFTKVDDESIPDKFVLYQNFPNPFNSTTKIIFVAPEELKQDESRNVIIKVYDLLGNEIATLFNEKTSPGKYEIQFDAAKYNLSGGVYFYQLRTGTKILNRKMVYLK
jgi:thiol-disulfide isomerase/thioredoxin